MLWEVNAECSNPLECPSVAFCYGNHKWPGLSLADRIIFLSLWMPNYLQQTIEKDLVSSDRYTVFVIYAGRTIFSSFHTTKAKPWWFISRKWRRWKQRELRWACILIVSASQSTPEQWCCYTCSGKEAGPYLFLAEFTWENFFPNLGAQITAGLAWLFFSPIDICYLSSRSVTESVLRLSWKCFWPFIFVFFNICTNNPPCTTQVLSEEHQLSLKRDTGFWLRFHKWAEVHCSYNEDTFLWKCHVTSCLKFLLWLSKYKLK